MHIKPPECAGCSLETASTGFVPPDGHGSIGVMIVGESPGENEVRLGKPFVQFAQAGSLLERVIKMCGLDRMQFRLTNIIQCRPPKDYLDNAPYELSAVSHCRVHRDRIIKEARPKVLLALGSLPLRYLTGESGKNRGVTYMRGYVLPATEYNDIPVISSFHPSFIKRGKQNYINVLAHDIRKAVAIAQGKFTNYCLYPNNAEEVARFVTYIKHPSYADAQSYYLRAKDSPNAVMYFDIETDESMFKDEDADDEIQLEIDAGQITQIQFSLGSGEAIAMPWAGEFRDIAVQMLALRNVKAGHNAWRFDIPVLKREHVEVAGIVHDTRWMWHHLQPDLPAHLQFVGSFYGMPFAWKHLAAYDEPFYGCADADAGSRIMATLPQQLEQKGTWRGYERQVVGLEPVLVGMSRRGIPIANEIRLELDTMLSEMQVEVNAEAQKIQPPALRKWKEYKRPPVDKTGLVLRDVTNPEDEGTQPSLFESELCATQRWCRQIPFNIGSYQQILEYIKFRKHPVPHKYHSEKETTELAELEKLHKKYKDAVYEMAIRYRNYQNLRSTFVQGWLPDAEGFVHPSFSGSTAVGQLASKSPNAQNFPKRGKLAKTMRRMIAAKPGYKIIEADFSSFHAVTLAFEAQSKNWLRLARADIHSFTTAHFLKLPERDKLLDLPDDALTDYLAWVKRTHTETRDNKAKHAILGVGNGLGYRKLYRQYSDFFTGEKEAKLLLDTIRGIFPEVFVYQNRRRREAHERTYLTTRFGYMRWFFDVLHWDSKANDLVPGEDSEAALCFNHVNDAFGHIREQMLWLIANGYDERWGLCNSIHDSLMFHCTDVLVEECVHTVYEQMTKRSPVLVEPVTSPDGLWVDAEVNVGSDWASMECVLKKKPVGLLQLGPEGKAELATLPALVYDIKVPTFAPTVEVADADIPF